MPKVKKTWITIPLTCLNILAIVLLGKFVAADGLAKNPEAYCREQQAAFQEHGLEMSTGPIEISGERWRIIWSNGDEDVFVGDQISVPFAKEIIAITGKSSAMADHLLTIEALRLSGREPMAVLYDDTIFLLVSYWDHEAQEAYCMSVPLE